MSPAHTFNKGNVPAPIGTPARVESLGNASLWQRVDESMQADEAKSNLMKELMYRYDYLSQEYEREIAERAQEREAVLSWQREKQQYDNELRAYQIAMERNPFVMIVIDGDGMIFRDEFLCGGEEGGRRAATQLHSAIVNYIEQENRSIPTDARIVCRVYANVRGLAEVLVRTGIVQDIGHVEDFMRGFTRGRTMFDFVDVGPGKDRADKKLIETFKLHANDLHCRQIFFGCSHDNGYARALEDYSTDPMYLSKITLLEGVPFEKELLVLPYATKKFPGIFRESKLVVHSASIGMIPPGLHNGSDANLPVVKNYNILGGIPTRFPPPSRHSSGGLSLLMDSPIPAKVSLNLPRTPSSSTLASDGMPAIKPTPPAKNWAAMAAAPAPSANNVTPTYIPVDREEVIARNRAGQRIDPQCKDYDKAEVDRIKKIKMCNVHFLRQECPYGSNCTHLHSYKPTNEELATLRLVARMAPCTNGSGCQDIKCIYGHRCPAPRGKNGTKGGKSCIFGESCKFSAELHDIDLNVVKTLVIR